MKRKKPTPAMAVAAHKGIALALQFRMGTERAIRRARAIELRESMDAEQVERMRSFFANYRPTTTQAGWGDLASPCPAWVVWLLWGGDAAEAWSKPRKRKAKHVKP